MERFASAASWNLEQPYETKPRALKNNKIRQNGLTRLPIKTAAGIVQSPSLDITNHDDDEDEIDENRTKATSAFVVAKERDPEQPNIPEKRRVLETKEELAKIAKIINEDPEENILMSRRIREMIDDHNPTIQKLSLLALMAIYKDVIPGYRIRPLNDDELRIKASKDVKKLWEFEQGLLSGYQQYLRQLLNLARTTRSSESSPDSKAVGSVAVQCACQLLSTVPHFNFRSELLKMIVEVISVKTIDDSFVQCRTTLEDMFRNDDDGNASLEAVQLLTKMLKSKRYRIDESVINIFLSLRLLSELEAKASQDQVESSRKRKKKDREFRTKKVRKRDKENKEIEKEMRQMDGTVSYEKREKMQSETLKLVFLTYFKILKERPSGLMGATLEGLAKFAHLINVDFFGDLVVALKELIEDAIEEEHDIDCNFDAAAARNATRESLLCIITAFTLLRGQSEKLMTVDLNFFTSHLYSTLLPLSLDAEIEYSTKKSMRLSDPNDVTSQRGYVNVATEVEMLIRALHELFFRQNGAMNPIRVAAFVKRILLSTLQVPEKSALANVGVVNKLGKKYHGKLAGLFSTEESIGDGVYKLEVDEPERSNPYAATLWEAVLLEKHYSPDVAQAVKEMTNNFKPVAS